MHTARRSQPSSTRLLLVVADFRFRGNGPSGMTSEGGLQVCLQPERGTVQTHSVSCTTRSAPSSTLTLAFLPINSLWNPRVSPGSRLAFSSGYSILSRVTPVAGPERGKIETLSCGSPRTVLEPASITKIRPRSATTVERRPMRSAASRICGRAKRAPNPPPTAQRRSAALAPRSLAASTASWPSILSFLTGWRSREAPSLSTSSARSSPNESMSPTTRSGTIPASSANLAPPSAATMRSARPATLLSRSDESADPFRKMAARTLRGFRVPVVQLSWRRLRPFQSLQQHHSDHQRDAQARGQVRGVVRRRVEVGVPTLRRDGGEEDYAREEVACEARKNGHCGAEDGTTHRWLEESCESKGAVGQRVVQDELHGMYHEKIDGEI